MGFFKSYFDSSPEVEFSSVILGGREISFTLARKKGVRNIGFTISPSRGLRITAPHNVETSKVYDLIYEKEKWILKHLSKIETLSKRPGIVSILGKEYPFSIVESTGREKVNILNDRIVIQVKHPRNTSKVLEKWFRKQAKEIIPSVVDKYKKHFSSSIGKVTIKGQKTRWGSCSPENNLNFNWKLLMSPQEIIDYVVIHELAHTIHHNHSKRFWNLVALVDPEYKRHRKWLKDNGHSLSLD